MIAPERGADTGVLPPIIVIALLQQISREMETHSALDKPRRRRF